MRTFAVLLTLIVCTSVAQAQPRVSDQALTRALAADPNDVPALIQGLVELRETFVVSSAQLERCLKASGLRSDPFVAGLLSNSIGVRVDGGTVKLSFSEETHLPMNDTDGSTLAWLHLAKTVSLEVAQEGRQLDRVRGLRVSLSKNGFRGELLSLKIGPTTISVRAGKFGVPLFTKTFVVTQPASANAAGLSGNLARG